MYNDTSKLIVWQKAHELVLKIYEITKDFPRDELKYQLLLARDLHYIDENKYKEVVSLVQEVGKLLNGLLVSVSKA